MNLTQPQSSPSSDPASQPNRGTRFNFWRWFWISALVISLPYAWYCFYVPSNSIAWADEYTSAQQRASETNKPMILFFTGKWCVPCRIMKRNVWADEQVAAAVNNAYIPVTIDVDDADAKAALDLYKIGATPHTIITDPKGNVLQQKQGGMNKSEFLELLGKVNPTSAMLDP